MYAVAPFQAWHAAPSYLAGRFVIVAFALGGVAAAWWLGSAAYGVVAGAVAAAVTAVETTHVAFSHAAVTDVPLTTLVTLALALLVTGRLEWAGVAIGLATAAKYPGALALVPLVVVGWRRWRRLAVSVALAALAFFAASPFVLIDAGDTWSALRRISREHREGWLGFEHDHWSGIAFAGKLWSGLGPVLVIAVVGLVLALARRSSRGDLVLGSFVVGYYVSLLPLHSHFPRYVLPLVPPLGALAGRMRSLAPVSLLLLVVPLTWSIRDDIDRTRTDTRIVAARWIAAHVPKGSVYRRRIVDRGAARLPRRADPAAVPGPRRERRRRACALGARERRRRRSRPRGERRLSEAERVLHRASAAPGRLQHGRARRDGGTVGGGVPPVTRIAVLVAALVLAGLASAAGPTPGGRPVILRGCDPLYYERVGMPQRLIVSDLPMEDTAHTAMHQMTQAIKLTLKDARLPRRTLQRRLRRLRRLRRRRPLERRALRRTNARLAARHPHVVGVIGTLDSGCARAELPALARGGLPLVSPLNTADDLTRGRAAVARLSATDSAQAAAAARYIEGAGARRVAALSDGTPQRRRLPCSVRARSRRRSDCVSCAVDADAAYVGGVLAGPTRRRSRRARAARRRRPARALVRVRPGRATRRHRGPGCGGRVALRRRRPRRAARRAGARLRAPLRGVDRQVAAPVRGVRGAGGARFCSTLSRVPTARRAEVSRAVLRTREPQG